MVPSLSTTHRSPFEIIPLAIPPWLVKRKCWRQIWHGNRPPCLSISKFNLVSIVEPRFNDGEPMKCCAGGQAKRHCSRSLSSTTLEMGTRKCVSTNRQTARLVRQMLLYISGIAVSLFSCSLAFCGAGVICHWKGSMYTYKSTVEKI